MAAESTRPEECPNCGAALYGPYCAQCGQHQLGLDRPLRDLLSEATDSLAAFDSRLVRTLRLLVRRPGELSLEFMRGRRAAYVHPFKLFLASSLLLFLVLSLIGETVVYIDRESDDVVAADVADVSEATTEADEETSTGGAGWFFSRLDRLTRDDPSILNRMFMDRMATGVVVLVPVFALLLRLAYRRSRYVTQLVVSLHVHTFGFLVLAVGASLDVSLRAAVDVDGPGILAAWLAVVVYLYLTLRRVYERGRVLTACTIIVLFCVYTVAMVVTAIATMVATIALS